ncbi:TPA: hypothetical protein JG832_002489 [Enterobacter hormaechei subsp. xiangfangensis]|nr:hypothetical protein [Enterobacter hormaechei subsp. xiangfangensis]HAV1890624.1 hypothetical protein [Enterobacter hormaechei subsp. xiangfangensis]
MNEIDSLMRTDAGGVIVYEGDDASQVAEFDEWLRTPVGAVWGLPGWGNNLADFKHEPSGNSTEIAIEAALMTKLRQDLPNIKLRGIRCNTITDHFDIYQISFVFPFGVLTTTVTSEGIV